MKRSHSRCAPQISVAVSCALIAWISSADVQAEGGLTFEEAEGTGLPEILTERRIKLEERAGGEKLKSHAWWLWGLAPIDFDRDEDLDLVIAIHGGTGGLIVRNLLRETGELKFENASVELGVDGLVPPTDNYPLIWDIDEDGFEEIVGLFDDRPAPVLWNRGGKKFEKANFTLHPINYPAEIRDLNGDGTRDISQVRRGQLLEFFYNAETRAFVKKESPWKLPDSLPASTRAEIAALEAEKHNRFLKLHFMPNHDLNGDGRPDMIVRGFGSYSGDRVGWILIANDAGKLEDRTESAGLTREGAPVLASDLDDDGDLDLLTASGEQAGQFLNNGDGKFTLRPGPLTDFLKRRAPYLHVVFQEDLDKDGDVDLAVSNRRLGQQRVFENLGAGEFEIALESRGWDADPLVLCDINNDGLTDVVIGGAGEKENIGIFLNRPAPARN